MRSAQQFPIHVRTGWIDFSPALRYYVSQRIQFLFEPCAAPIRSITVHISGADPHRPVQRRCDIEVATTDGGISASAVGADVFALVGSTAETVLEKLRERAGGYKEPPQRIA
jgi:ribosome-associated translation inhibitor RaiA